MAFCILTWHDLPILHYEKRPGNVQRCSLVFTLGNILSLRKVLPITKLWLSSSPWSQV
jgi:hypothetical protein